jgi:simple sugar transport system permease protein
MKSKLIQNIISVFLSVMTTLFITSVLLIFIGRNPADVFSVMLYDVFGSGYGLGQALFKATPLIFCSTGLAICFHASLFNIGAEGQLNAGAFAIAISLVVFSYMPAWLLFPVSLIIGFVMSGIIGLIPAYIKIKKGVSEVITTIMMNFIIMAVINYLLINFFAVKSTVRTEKISDSVMLPKLSDYSDYFQGSSLNFSFIIAIILALAAFYLIYKTKYGYQIRSVGFNPVASKYFGINVNKVTLLAFAIGAGMTSLAGLNYIIGYKGYYEYGFSGNVGFTAIAVSLLAKNNPVGIIFSALLFGVLDYGGLAVNTIVPKEIMFVVQAIVILSIISIDKIVKYYFENKMLKIGNNLGNS